MCAHIFPFLWIGRQTVQYGALPASASLVAPRRTHQQHLHNGDLRVLSATAAGADCLAQGKGLVHARNDGATYALHVISAESLANCLAIHGSYVLHSLPFDMQTAGGYAVGFVIHIVFITYNMTVCMAVDGLFIGACIFAEAYLDDLIEHIVDMDESYGRTGNRSVLRVKLVKAVQRHVEFYVLVFAIYVDILW